MNRQSNRFFVLFISIFFAFLAGACEGGKNKNSCLPGDSSEECKTDKPKDDCPAGQVLEGGVCVTEKTECSEGYIAQDGECVLQCPSGFHEENGECQKDGIHIEIVNQSACNADNGYQQIIVQFIARDEQGYAIDPELNNQGEPTVLSSEMLINGRPVNVESVISRKSELLKSDLMLSLVLDNSRSMMEHSPPAFAPMKEAAISILQQTKAKWDDNDSDFGWRLLWFNDYLYKPALNTAEEGWSISDINRLPTPSGGTELYKAIHHMVGVHKGLYESGVAAGERDQHVMIVLSDGEDTHSHVDNKEYLEEKNLDQELFWTQFGAAAVSKDALLSTLATSQPNLRVHVIGLGELANTEGELNEIAAFGRGLYFYGAGSNALRTVFEDVQKEFITIQTIGVTTSLVPDTYEFSLKVKHDVTLEEGLSDEVYTVEVNDTLPDCP